MDQASFKIAWSVFILAVAPLAYAVSPAPDGGYVANNTAEGTSALFSLTSGIDNTALGFRALYANTTGNYNSGTGFRALFFNTTGAQNTANGTNALGNNVIGDFNTAVGVNALYRNANGNSNSALGAQALFNNTVSNNTAVGYQALLSNTTGGAPSGSGPSELGPNTAVGSQALLNNTTGGSNTALGFRALASITDGGFSTAFGYKALAASTGCCNNAYGYKALTNNTGGVTNTATGDLALYNNTTGNGNVAHGFGALMNNVSANSCTAIGHAALINTTGDGNIALGASAGSSITTGSNNIDIGHFGAGADSGVTRIGTTGVHTKTFIAGIRDVTTDNGDAINVVIDSAGQLGTISSSKRFKKEIKPMDRTSESILSLRPVTFHYKSDQRETPQFGLIAEEVAEVNPDLVVRDGNGEIYSVRYEAVNAMLLNEFLKEHRKVARLEGALAEQQAQTAVLLARFEEQEAKINKVNAKLEARTPAKKIALREP